MDHKIESILEDLYRIDPSFKQHEKKLRTVVTELLSSKPDTQFNERFAMRLREKLMRANAKSVVSPYTHLYLHRWGYGLIGSLLTLLLALPLTYFGTKTVTQNNVSTGFTMEQQIEDKGSNAFGNLGTIASIYDAAGTQDLSSATLQEQAVAATPISDTSATSSAVATTMTPSLFSVEEATTSTSSQVAPAPMPKLFPYRITNYVYKGTTLATSTAQGTVYKRVKTDTSSTQLATILNNANFGLLNLGAFSNFKTQSLQVAEDKNYGYIVDINFNEGSIAINPNWDKWPQPTNVAPLTSRPTDDQLIAMANAFLAEKGINHAIYGTPVVENVQVRMYAKNTTASAYVPEVINVIYPLMLGGTEVYDETGNPYGLTVSINIRQNKVSGVYNISSQTYESASYDLETDPSQIISYVQSNHMPVPTNGNAQTSTLQTPKKVLVRHWTNATSSPSSEVFIPAYMFPVESTSTTFGPKEVVVPLVKSVFQEQKKQPMPMMKQMKQGGQPQSVQMKQNIKSEGKNQNTKDKNTQAVPRANEKPFVQ